MSAAVITVLAVAVVALGAVVLREERRRRRITAGAERILFPLAGRSLSERTLAAALRLAQAEHATLVPAYLARVPLHLPMDTPLPRECADAMPLLEVIEQRAAARHVPVDARIAAGRTYRHALTLLFEQEHFDRIVVAAQTEGTEGFSADDVAWLLDHAPGEVVALRPEPRRRTNGQPSRPREPNNRRRGAALRAAHRPPARTR